MSGFSSLNRLQIVNDILLALYSGDKVLDGVERRTFVEQAQVRLQDWWDALLPALRLIPPFFRGKSPPVYVVAVQ